MPTTIVVGGQYGSEGKGKVVALCAADKKEPWVIRCGGPNSGHTTSVGGHDVVLRQIPAAAGHPNALLMLSAGCAVDEDLLLTEIRTLGLPRERIVVDPRAVVVSAADKAEEEQLAADFDGGFFQPLIPFAKVTGSPRLRRVTRATDERLLSRISRRHSCSPTLQYDRA
jgi:adenylosuccinate synthase